MKLIAATLLVVTIFVQPSIAAEQPAKSPLLGVWSVDVSRLPMAPAVRPKSVTITFSEVASNSLRTLVEVVDPAGNRMDADGVTPLDGAPTAVKSNFETDISATTMPRPEVLIMQLGKNGIPASTRIYSVNADGNSMTETVAHFTTDGKPVLRRNYFTRVR
jgi:hypothetical protein